MTSLRASAKKSVNLASSGVKVSRIRRDPPPKVKVKEVDIDEIDRSAVVVGVIIFALSVFVIILAFSSWSGWSPTEYRLEMNAAE